MTDTLRICNRCYHFAPEAEGSCLNCGHGFDDSESYPFEQLLRFEKAVQVGWHRRYLLGLAIFGGSFILLFTIAGYRSALPKFITDSFLTLSLLLFLAGPLLSAVSVLEMRRWKDELDDQEEDHHLNIAEDFLKIIVGGVIIGVLLFIPIVNILVGLALVYFFMIETISYLRLYGNSEPLISPIQSLVASGQKDAEALNYESAVEKLEVATRAAECLGEIEVLKDALDHLRNISESAAEEGQNEQATRGVEVIRKTIDSNPEQLSLDRYGDSLDQIEAYQPTEEFKNETPYIRDTVRSSENSLAAGDYEKAIRRFRTALDEIPPSVVPEEEEVAQNHRDLSKRATEGMAEAHRRWFSVVLPENLTSVERDFLDGLLKRQGGPPIDSLQDENLVDVWKGGDIGSPSERGFSKAIELINSYRESRSEIEGVTLEDEEHRSSFDQYVSRATQSSDGDSSAEEFIESFKDGLETARLYASALRFIGHVSSSSRRDSINNSIANIEQSLSARGNYTTDEDLQDVIKVIDELYLADRYADAFPSLPIEDIIQDINDRLNLGEEARLERFEEEFSRIDRMVEEEAADAADEVESFAQDWENHPAIEAGAWVNLVEEAKEDGQHTAIFRAYQKAQEMSNATWSVNSLQQYDPTEFEHLIATLYEAMGYETRVTSKAGDLGVDVWAEDEDERLAIQVKRFDRGNTVGRPVIQKLESMIARGNAHRVVVVSSSTFADTAEAYARDSDRVELVDGRELVRRLTEYQVPSA